MNTASSSTAVAPAPAATPQEVNVMIQPGPLAKTVEDAMYKKATTPVSRTIILAMLAGFWIALGFVFFVTSQVGGANIPAGPMKVLGGTVFSVGLLLTVMTGGDLFTSTTMTLIPKAAGRLSWGQVLKHWAIVWFFNFVGSVFAALLCFWGGLPHNMKGGWGKVVVDSASTKLGHSWTEAFVLGILCNICVCAAVWMSIAAKTVVGKAAAVVGPVALFVATGMEHSVANMFLLPLAVMIRDLGGMTGIDAATYPLLEWGRVLLGNLIPVTLGNIIGGGVLVGLGNWYAQRPATPATPAAVQPTATTTTTRTAVERDVAQH